MSSGEYHEPYEHLPQDAIEYHRMIKSLMEELEAVDWYNQRASICTDAEAKAIFEHNRDEEIEHACMALEWLRRKYPVWDEMMKEFLYTEGSIIEAEANMGSENKGGKDEEEEIEKLSDGSLQLGSLK